MRVTDDGHRRGTYGHRRGGHTLTYGPYIGPCVRGVCECRPFVSAFVGAGAMKA